VTTTMLGPGVDLSGAKVIADFNDATQRAITIRIPASRKNVALRGMKFLNGSIIAESPALDALGFICLTNQSWIYSWKLIDLDIEHFSRDYEASASGLSCRKLLQKDGDSVSSEDQPICDSAAVLQQRNAYFATVRQQAPKPTFGDGDQRKADAFASMSPQCQALNRCDRDHRYRACRC
jgi:hypothetical protein